MSENGNASTLVILRLLQNIWDNRTVENYATSAYLQHHAAGAWAVHAQRHEWTGTSVFGIPTAASSIEDALLLYALALAVKPLVVVEVGRYYGLSTCALAAAIQQNGVGRLYSIDNNNETDSNSTNEALANLRRYGLSDVVEVIVGDGNTRMQELLPALDKVDLFFEDGDHRLDSLKTELGVLLPYLNTPAYLVFHDAIVLDAVDRAMQWVQEQIGAQHCERLTVGTWRGLGVLRKH